MNMYNCEHNVKKKSIKLDFKADFSGANSLMILKFIKMTKAAVMQWTWVVFSCRVWSLETAAHLLYPVLWTIKAELKWNAEATPQLVQAACLMRNRYSTDKYLYWLY